jgi:lipopolysaccharide export system protein LptC
MIPFEPLLADVPEDLLRRRRNMDLWRRRSRMIHFFRKALPAAAASIVLGLIAWIVIKALLATIIDVRGGSGAAIRMINPKFYGQDGQGRAFMLGAAEAARTNDDLKQIVLTQPNITLNINSATPTSARADSGQYHENDKVLHMDGHVVFTSPEGYVFKTGKAVIDTQTGVVEGDQKVEGSGPMGDIQADNYGIYDRGARIIFRGDVHGRIKRD